MEKNIMLAQKLTRVFCNILWTNLNTLLGQPNAKKRWRRQWHPTPVLLPRKSHGRRRLVGCSPWGREESDTTERLHFHFSLSCIGEGNVHPLQCSCLENPRDGGAWWAVVYGVAQGQTWLKQLSSSSSLQIPWWLSVPLLIPRLGNLLWALELLKKCKNLFGIIVFQFVGVGILVRN